MPYSRPGYMYYDVATKSVVHGGSVTEHGMVGVAVKQGNAPFGTGPAFSAPGVVNPLLNTIAIAEPFAMITKGIVEVPLTGIVTPAKGDAVYIVAADNTLTKTAGANLKYGRIVEIAGQRGCPTGKVRIDLDHKATF